MAEKGRVLKTDSRAIGRQHGDARHARKDCSHHAEAKMIKTALRHGKLPAVIVLDGDKDTTRPCAHCAYKLHHAACALRGRSELHFKLKGNWVVVQKGQWHTLGKDAKASSGMQSGTWRDE